MSGLMNALSVFSSHKRKRSSNDISDVSAPDWKRRTTALPIRSTPQRRPASIFTQNPTFTTFAGALTPVDTDEDESLTHENDDYSSARLPSLTESQSSNDTTSTSSVKVHVDERDQDMEMTLSSPTRPRIGRARSNDILPSPRRRPNFLSSESPHAARDRIPTPISGHFDPRLSELPNAPRHSFPPLRTNLSPTVEQENWVTGPDGLPSPTEDYSPQIHDPDAMMVYDQTSDSMNGLRVSGVDDDAMGADQSDANRRQPGHEFGMDGHSSQGHSTSHTPGHSRQESLSQGRTARLHMGFLAGCDKCLQKVPGHYSHILWS